MSIVETIKNQFGDGKFSTDVFVDLKKTFDTDDHQILFQKLDFMVSEESQMNGLHHTLKERNNLHQLVIITEAL